jgi:hypothetical protein
MERADRLVSAHATWALQHGITAIPAVFYNGRRLPIDIRVEDVKYIIKYSALANGDQPAGVRAAT